MIATQRLCVLWYKPCPFHLMVWGAAHRGLWGVYIGSWGFRRALLGGDCTYLLHVNEEVIMETACFIHSATFDSLRERSGVHAVIPTEHDGNLYSPVNPHRALQSHLTILLQYDWPIRLNTGEKISQIMKHNKVTTAMWLGETGLGNQLGNTSRQVNSIV